VSSSGTEKFGNKLRLRVCGLCFNGDDVLLINHKGLYAHDFWAPPGGGVEFGEKAENALKREFLEECQVEIEVGQFLFACEFVRPPLHALELFFEVKLLGNPRLGVDPEMLDDQIISDVRFMDSATLGALPYQYLHGLFQKVGKTSAIRDLRGFFTIT
jgi:8-oxo-dGTP diphosphatase